MFVQCAKPFDQRGEQKNRPYVITVLLSSGPQFRWCVTFIDGHPICGPRGVKVSSLSYVRWRQFDSSIGLVDLEVGSRVEEHTLCQVLAKIEHLVRDDRVQV